MITVQSCRHCLSWKRRTGDFGFCWHPENMLPDNYAPECKLAFRRDANDSCPHFEDQLANRGEAEPVRKEP